MLGIRPARRRGRSRPVMSACVAAAAPTPSRGTGRGTPTPIARRATRARSRGAGPASAWSRQCSTGAAATDGCRRRTTGRARTPARGRGARAPQHRRLAFRRRGDRRLRELEGGTSSGRRAGHPDWRWQSTVAGASVLTTRPAGREVIADRQPNAHDCPGSGCADRDSGEETLYLEGSAFQRRLKRDAVSRPPRSASSAGGGP